MSSAGSLVARSLRQCVFYAYCFLTTNTKTKDISYIVSNSSCPVPCLVSGFVRYRYAVKCLTPHPASLSSRTSVQFSPRRKQVVCQVEGSLSLSYVSDRPRSAGGHAVRALSLIAATRHLMTPWWSIEQCRGGRTAPFNAVCTMVSTAEKAAFADVALACGLKYAATRSLSEHVLAYPLADAAHRACTHSGHLRGLHVRPARRQLVGDREEHEHDRQPDERAPGEHKVEKACHTRSACCDARAAQGCTDAERELKRDVEEHE
jgi:hypothetical protein